MKELKFFEKQPESGIKPSGVVVLLHGYGANAMNLMPLAYEFSDILQDWVFIAPNAPFPFEGMGEDSYQWYSLSDRSDEMLFSQAKKAEVILNNFLDDQLKRLNLEDKNMIVMGFSQGGMMSMHTLYRRSKACAAVISFSGYMSGIEHLKNDIKSKPPILLCHGTRDPIVPYKAKEVAAAALRNLEVEATEHSVDRLGHSIDEDCIVAAKSFLKKHISLV